MRYISMKRILPLASSSLLFLPALLTAFRASAEADTTAFPTQDAIVNSGTDTIVSEEETDVITLDEFVIEQRKKLVESDGAKLTYNVTEDPQAAASNILDVLKKVPGISVDAEDNVKVNGQSSFRILMNGHEDPMLRGDLKTVLKSLPAGTVKKIEVISEPGAKYESEGLGGILNIVTDHTKSLSGFSTQLSTWIGSLQAGGYINGKTKLNKLMLDATLSYNTSRIREPEISASRKYEYLNDPSFRLQQSDQKLKNSWDYTGANVNMSWEPDSLNLFTFSMQYGHNGSTLRGDDNRSMYDHDMHPIWTINREINQKKIFNNAAFQASFQHNFKREDNNLVVSYEFDFGRMKNTNNYLLKFAEGAISEPEFSSNRTKDSDKSHILQIDYSNRLSPKHLFEAGGKAYITLADQFNLPLFGESEDSASPDENQSVDLTQFKDIYSLYSSYTGSFSKWSLKAGLRYEHTRMGAKYRAGDYPDYVRHLNDIVPNAAVSYNFSPSTSLRLAYQMRISRPGISQVNPYRNTMTPGQVTYGNPDLKSVRIHNMSIAYSNYGGSVGGSMKFFYRYTGNNISSYIFMQDGLLNSTSDNLGVYHAPGVEISGSWNVTSDLSWSIYGSTTYEYLKSDSQLLKAKNCGWQGYVNTDINYTLPCKIRTSAYGGFWTPWRSLQENGSDIGYYYGVGVSRSWLKDDALTVQLGASDFFTPHRTSASRMESESAIVDYRVKYSVWNVAVGITFKFGGLKASVRSTAANIEKEESGTSSSKQSTKL